MCGFRSFVYRYGSSPLSPVDLAARWRFESETRPIIGSFERARVAIDLLFTNQNINLGSNDFTVAVFKALSSRVSKINIVDLRRFVLIVKLIR